MENRDRDKRNKNISSTSNLNKEKSDSKADFGEKIGQSEKLKNSPSGRISGQGSSSVRGDSGRGSSGSSEQ